MTGGALSTVDDVRVYRAEEWPHGLRCSACSEEFIEGQPISERLDGFCNGLIVVDLLCVACNVTGAPLDD